MVHLNTLRFECFQKLLDKSIVFPTIAAAPSVVRPGIFVGSRAGLKPMQPHWAPRLWGPRAMVFGQVIHYIARYSILS